jgi:hypothetical protein
MAFWSAKKRRPSEIRQVVLPGDVGTISIPSEYSVEMEDDSTLMVFPEFDDITLRFSSISFVPKDADDEMAKSVVAESAAEQGRNYLDMDDKGIEQFDELAEQNGVTLIVKSWKVGTKNTIIYASATIIRDRVNSQRVKSIIEEIPAMLRSIQITKTHRIIRAEEKEIEATIQTVDSLPQSITSFGNEDCAWLNDNEEQARILSLKYGSGGDLEPQELDRIFSRWLSDDDPKESEEVIANALGAALGNCLEHHGFRWVVVTDELGSEYAVRHNVGETMAFPRASVWKRIENRKTDFFHGLYLAAIDQVRRSSKEIDQ